VSAGFTPGRSADATSALALASSALHPTAAAYRLAAAIARALPEPVAQAAGRIGGRTARFTAAGRRAQVERNVRRVLGPDASDAEVQAAVAQTFESYARYWVESFRLPGMPVAAVDAGMTIEGWEHAEDGLAAGRGVIMALPHLGGWEWGGFWLAEVKGRPTTAVVESLEPPELFDWFAELRRALGMTVVPLGPGAGQAVLRALKANHIVTLVSDRDLDGSGVEVEFFGERTSLPAGPATLALRTGAVLLPVAVYYRDGRHHGVIRPPIPVAREGRLRDDVARITQALAVELEDLVRAAPDQWHLMQPNWPSDPGYRQDRRSSER
jgi:lauroyl/myristoyl acyltransferase